MANSREENIARLVGVWKSKGWNSRDDITSVFDERMSVEQWEGIEGVGKKYAVLQHELMAMSCDEFENVTNLPCYREDGLNSDGGDEDEEGTGKMSVHDPE